MKFSVDRDTVRRIIRNGSKYREGTVSVRYLPLDRYLFTPVLSKKQGNAVARHRIKRIIREYMRTHQAVHPSGAYMIYPNGPCKTMSETALRTDIDVVMKRLISHTAGKS